MWPKFRSRRPTSRMVQPNCGKEPLNQWQTQYHQNTFQWKLPLRGAWNTIQTNGARSSYQTHMDWRWQWGNINWSNERAKPVY